MSVTIAGIDFVQHDYDERGDVLYLNTALHDGTRPPVRALPTPEGHNVEYDEAGRVVSLTLVNVRALVERDGELTITWPPASLRPKELATVLAPVVQPPRQ
jgi:uncharacterized protein YuzE